METLLPARLPDRPGKFALAADLEKVIDILRGYDVQRIILFGSVARGDYRPDSDIDLCVVGLPPEKYFSAVGACLMGLDRPVSLIDLKDATGYFRERVLSEGKVVYERGSAS